MIKQEEPCEGRLSSTVPWEGEGEIPLPDPIIKQKLSESFSLKKQSEELLELAKRAVEVAIEEGEEAGLRLVNEFGVN